jgi:hypothetical protein
MYGGMETLLHAFLTSALDGVSRDRIFTPSPKKKPPGGDSVGSGWTFSRKRPLQPVAWRSADNPQRRGGLHSCERVEVIPWGKHAVIYLDCSLLGYCTL